MANKKISELTSTVPTGDEELVLAASGENYKATVDDIANYTDEKISPRLPSVLTQEEYEEQIVLHPERATDGVVRFRYYEEAAA